MRKKEKEDELPEGAPTDEALAEVLHARRLLDELLDLGLDGEGNGRLEVASGQLVRDSVDDLHRVLVFDFATVGAWR